MASCCSCSVGSSGSGGAHAGLPLLCLVPRDDTTAPLNSRAKTHSAPGIPSTSDGFHLLDNEYIKKNFKLPQPALYLDPFRRPLITFPMTQEGRGKNFNIDKKQKINQQILDGFLDPNEAISAPSVFPYAKSSDENRKEEEGNEEVIYVLQLPDWEYKCPIHNQSIRTPRFIWHTCKKSTKDEATLKQGRGPLHKPKPWLLSRHTDFDLMSQW